ncbi:MAG: nucleotidyltransferase domain-containing protein [Gemmatimonadetes bacterium]|nr:nucleotidyltransferase domain-containing protein [Gemmatimonadota bacterium]
MTATQALELALPAPDRLADVVRRHGIRLLLLHGSQAKGRLHAKSDLDLAVQLEDPDRNPFELAADLQALFPKYQVDVVSLNRADPLLAWQVCRDARLLAGDPTAFANRCLYAWRRYVEYRPFLELEARAVTNRLAQLRDAG